MLEHVIYALRILALLTSFWKFKVSKSFLYLFALANIIRSLFLPLGEEGLDLRLT